MLLSMNISGLNMNSIHIDFVSGIGVLCVSANMKIVLQIEQFHGKMDACITELCPICINIAPQVAVTTYFQRKTFVMCLVNLAKKE